MNPFLSHPRERLSSWKQLREHLSSERNDDEHLDAVVKFWSHAPIASPYLDYLQPSSWPDAWELIDSNDFDQNAIGLGIFYTLMLAADGRWKDRLKLCMIKRPDDCIERLVVIADRSKMLNYYHNSIAAWPLPGETHMMHQYQHDSVHRTIVEI